MLVYKFKVKDTLYAVELPETHTERQFIDAVNKVAPGLNVVMTDRANIDNEVQH